MKSRVTTAGPEAREGITRKREFLHAILDIRTQKAKELDMGNARQIITSAAKSGGLHVVKISSHRFGKNAFTTFALLSQSHIAIHTWPEFDYIACDVFSCGGELDSVVQHILKALTPQNVTSRIIHRDVPLSSRYDTTFVDETGPGIKTVYAVKTVRNVRSRFQDIKVLEHERFGKMLVINDDVQFAETDHAIYDEALLSPLAGLESCDRILVIGGGDGLCCTYLAESGIGKRIDVFELDPAVREMCLKEFPKISVGISSPKVHFSFGDATKSIGVVRDEAYDAVVVDTTAPDTSWGAGTYSRAFLTQCKRVLRTGGLLTLNGTSLWYDYDLDIREIRQCLRLVFGNVRMSTKWIPSFGSPWGFFTSRKTKSS